MMRSSVLATFLLAAACSVSSTSTESGPPSSGDDGGSSSGGDGGNPYGTDPGTPVKAQPLAGTVLGKPFRAVTAITRPLMGTARDVVIYPVPATCDNEPQLQENDLQIIATIDPWMTGAAYELDQTHSITFLTMKNGTPDNTAAYVGRVEVQSAGTAASDASTGVAGTLGLRATDTLFQTNSSVEGTVTVVDCP